MISKFFMPSKINPESAAAGALSIGISNAGSQLFVPLKKKLNAQLQKTFRSKLKIVRARFDNEAGIIGSAAVALERLRAESSLVT